MSGPSQSVNAPQQASANGVSAEFTRTDNDGRKPSVVISANGATGQLPNGAMPSQSARHNIAFGSLTGNSQQSNMANNINSHQPQHNGLQNAATDLRIASPQPIPQPPASGGSKPLAPLQGSANGLVFGSSNMDTTGSYAAGLRRESSQSGHSVGFMGPNARGGRGSYSQGQQYGGNAFSPSMANRQAINTRNHGGMSSPYNASQPMHNAAYNNARNASPMVNAMVPNMPHQGMYPGQPFNQQYDYYNSYYQPIQQMSGQINPQMNASYYPPQSQSPRVGQQLILPYGGPPAGQSPYIAPQITRTTSQMSMIDRPSSSMSNKPQTSSNNNNNASSKASTFAPASSTTASSAPTFKIPPKRQSKAIVIKNAQGEEIHFDKKSTPPAATSTSVPASSPSVPVAASTSSSTTPTAAPIPTPPSRAQSVSTASGSQSKVEPRNTKTDEEIKVGFQEQVKRQIEAQKELDRKGKSESVSESKTTDVEDVSPTTKEPVKAEIEKEVKAATVESVKMESASKSSETDKDAPKIETAKSEDDEAARLKREEDERIEREIAEMEAAEREEEERERAYSEKKVKAAEEKKKLEAAKADDDMKRMEREAEELEAKREKDKTDPKEEESAQTKADKALFSSLKKPTLGPGANLSVDTSTSATGDESMSPMTVTFDTSATSPQKSARPKPAHLKLKTDKNVEPAQPTPGMQALRSARLLDIKHDHIQYPEGILSPNPAINQTAKQRGRAYDKAFLLQFQDVFKEKPTVDWDQRIKDTLGDAEPGSARASSSRQNSVSMSSRQPSNRPQAVTPGYGGPMGSFGGAGRTLPSGTTSMERFNASQGGRPSSAIPGGFGGRTGAFPMGQAMSRSGSLQPLNQGGNPPSPRPTASKGKGSRRGGDRAMSRKEDESNNKSMPLTAGLELAALEKSSTGWTARSIGQPLLANAVAVDGSMPPDMVQRKVKAALNKMTPEKFDKISDQIMEIANQSRKETDGRTLRQVIQLTFEKACDEAHWAGMYAKFCQKMLTTLSNDIVDETIKGKDGNPVTGTALFRKYLLNRCQEEFERGWEANLPEKPEGETEEAALLSDAYYEAAAAKRRGLGLIQFIGELYKLGMLSKMIMHQCVLRLLNFEGQPDESTVENVSKLLRTIGSTMEADEQGHTLMNMYFERINVVLDQHKDLPSRSRFMLMDLTDLRSGEWKDKTASKGPKTIQEIHAEAEAAQAAAEVERQRQNSRGGGRLPPGRGDARSFSSQGMPPPDYPRNQVGMDDLRRLQSRNAQPRQMSQQGLGPNLGPGSSLFASGRSGSGRKGLGPPRDGEVSGNSSRTGTPPVRKEEKEATPQANAFSALAALDNDGGDMAQSPPSTKASPAITKTEPVADTSSDAA